MTHLADERRASPNTVAAYGRDLDALLAFMAAKDAKRGIDVYVLRAWLGELARTCKATSVARKIASVITGGDVAPGTVVTEQWFLDLEREAFLSMCTERKTVERIQHMLKKGKPLRN